MRRPVNDKIYKPTRNTRGKGQQRTDPLTKATVVGDPDLPGVTKESLIGANYDQWTKVQVGTTKDREGRDVPLERMVMVKRTGRRGNRPYEVTYDEGWDKHAAALREMRNRVMTPQREALRRERSVTALGTKEAQPKPSTGRVKKRRRSAALLGQEE